MKYTTRIIAVLAVVALFVIGAMALNAAEVGSDAATDTAVGAGDFGPASSVGLMAAGCGDCPHKKAKAERKKAKGKACLTDCTCNDDGTCTCADGEECSCVHCACAGYPHAKAAKDCPKDCPHLKDGKCTCDGSNCPCVKDGKCVCENCECEGCPHAKAAKDCTCNDDGTCTCADGTDCTCADCKCEGCPRAKAAHKAKAKGERPCPHSGG